MRIYLGIAGAIAIAVISTASVSARQIGPRIKIGGGNVCVAGVGVCNGKLSLLPSADEAIDTLINSTPFAFASDADKKNIHTAVKTTGYISTIIHDPVTGLVIITVLEANGRKRDVVVATRDAPPTGATWTFSAKCIVMQEGKKITAMFDTSPPHLNKQEIHGGDTIVLTAPFCEDYQKASVTSARVKFTGLTPTGDLPPAYTNFLVGDQL